MLSHRTVQNHVQNTLAKLHLHNRVELVRYAIEHGLDTGPQPLAPSNTGAPGHGPPRPRGRDAASTSSRARRLDTGAGRRGWPMRNTATGTGSPVTAATAGAVSGRSTAMEIGWQAKPAALIVTQQRSSRRPASTTVAGSRSAAPSTATAWARASSLMSRLA